MNQDWDAVAEAITARMAELGMRQRDLADAADVGLSTVQELQNNWKPRRRNRKTLAAISEALGWPSGQIEAIARGRPEEIRPSVEEQLAEIRSRLDALERRLGD